MGTPQIKIPTPKSAAWRLRPTRAAAASAPKRPPTPTAELRKPTPAWPVSSNLSAMTTMSTLSIPSTKVWAEKSPTRRRMRRSRAIVRKPASNSSTTDTTSRSRFGSALGCIPAMRSADQSMAAPVTRKTTPGPAAASSGPPKRRGRDADEAREKVDHGRRGIGERGEGGTSNQGRPGEVRAGHHPTAVVAVAKECSERGSNGRGEPASQSDHPDGSSAALLVGVDDDRDPVRPGADDRGRPGKLDPA